MVSLTSAILVFPLAFLLFSFPMVMGKSEEIKKKKSAGRKKIPMAKIENEAQLQVSFSKRRLGVFKKASELCTLCAAKLVVVVFSPAGKPFSFGNPDVLPVIDRYLGNGNEVHVDELAEVVRDSSVRKVTQEQAAVKEQIEEEKEKGERLRQMVANDHDESLVLKEIEDLSMEESEEMLKLVYETQMKIQHRIYQLIHQPTLVQEPAADESFAPAS